MSTKKRGRPLGSKNKPNPLNATIKESFPRTPPRRRAPDEQFQGTKHLSGIALDAVSHTCLKLHALRRNVPMAWLITDVLNLWLAASTDYDQAIFKDILPRNARAARTPERFAGYVESLGFVEAAPAQDPIPAPTPQPAQSIGSVTIELPPVPEPSAFTPEALLPTPNTYTGPSLADLSQAYTHPMALQGSAASPHPEPRLPHNASAFNPDAHAQILEQARKAREAAGISQTDLGLPPLAEDVARWAAHYKVRPEDIR